MAISVSDLKDQTGHMGPHPFLYCDYCQSECSANKSDYEWRLAPEYVFMCCREPMRLVRRHVELIDVPIGSR